MADRNPYIPSERRQDVETKEHDTEEQDNRRFAEKQAELHEQGEANRDKSHPVSGNREQ